MGRFDGEVGDGKKGWALGGQKYMDGNYDFNDVMRLYIFNF